MGTIDKCEMKNLINQYILADNENRREICSIFKDRDLMKKIIAYLAEPYQGKVDYVAAPESLGFMLGAMMADALDVGFVPIRNGKVAVVNDDEAVRASYIDHRDIARSLQVRKDKAFENCRFLLVDDWIETAATMQACITIIEEMQASVSGITTIGVEPNPATASMVESGFIRHIL